MIVVSEAELTLLSSEPDSPFALFLNLFITYSAVNIS